MPGRLMQQLLLSSRVVIRPVLQETAIAPRQNIWPMFHTLCTDILISQIKTIEERDEKRSFIRLWKIWLKNPTMPLAAKFLCVTYSGYGVNACRKKVILFYTYSYSLNKCHRAGRLACKVSLSKSFRLRNQGINRAPFSRR